tara:strand:+ start:13 stop:201 length:189 start_codon:yes stop_codon:yes gene_type:complete
MLSIVNKVIKKNPRIGLIDKSFKPRLYELIEVFPPSCPVCNKVIKNKKVCELPFKIKDCPLG